MILSIGNTLYQTIESARRALFRQSELANFAYLAYEVAVLSFQNEKLEHLDLVYPIGWNADNTPMNSRPRRYSKDEFVNHYQVLAFQELALNGLFRLVTIVETMLADIVRALVLKYPAKLGEKKSIDLGIVLRATSIEEVHVHATDALLNELLYKSPHEFALAARSLISCDLLECPAYHKYMEVKATRDIHIHNGGIANEIYRRKAGSHARVTKNAHLPVNLQYFFQSYEICLHLTEWLEGELHNTWPSSDREAGQKQLQLPLADPVDQPTDPAPVARAEGQD